MEVLCLALIMSFATEIIRNRCGKCAHVAVKESAFDVLAAENAVDSQLTEWCSKGFLSECLTDLEVGNLSVADVAPLKSKKRGHLPLKRKHGTRNKNKQSFILVGMISTCVVGPLGLASLDCIIGCVCYACWVVGVGRCAIPQETNQQNPSNLFNSNLQEVHTLSTELRCMIMWVGLGYWHRRVSLQRARRHARAAPM
eukprot:4497631-Amphidinium_carterae.1